MKESRIDLSSYKPQPHPFKEVFKQHGVTTGTIANYLDRSYPYVNNILNGNFRMPKSMYEKLLKLVRQLKADSEVEC